MIKIFTTLFAPGIVLKLHPYFHESFHPFIKLFVIFQYNNVFYFSIYLLVNILGVSNFPLFVNNNAWAQSCIDFLSYESFYRMEKGR